jgi:hypothetical protein
MDVLLYAWTGPKIPVAKATVLSVDPNTIVGGEPLGPGTYEVIVNVPIKRDTILTYQYEDVLYISDVVTRSIAWPSSKVITMHACVFYVHPYVFVMLTCDNFARRSPTNQRCLAHLVAEIFQFKISSHMKMM